MSVTCKCRSSNRWGASITIFNTAVASFNQVFKCGRTEKVRRAQPTKVAAGGEILRVDVPRDMDGGYLRADFFELGHVGHRKTASATRRERSFGRRTHEAERTRAEGENL